MSSSDPATERPKKSFPAHFMAWLSGFGLATALLVILMVLTWLATLEQVHHGLHATLEKYFTPKELWVFPDAAVIFPDLAGKEKYLPPLPGGYWVCALLVINLTLGGLIKLRKSPKTIGILLSHFGIVFMMIAGGVAQLTEERGLMMLSEKEGAGLPTTSDYAQSLTETTVEVIEVKDGKPVGQVHFVEDKYFKDLEKAGDTRTIRIPSLPFDLEFARYVQNSRVVSAQSMAPSRGEPIVEGWFLYGQDPGKMTEQDTPGVHVKVLGRDGKNSDPFILTVPEADSFAPRAPYTYRTGDRTFAIRMEKRIWPVPFQVRLKDARSEYFPHTTKPKFFESDIVRIEDGRESDVFIEMNEPMRYAGLTFYQHTMINSAPRDGGEATISGFEVVRNPSDQWPKYSIYIAGFGLCLHFALKLWSFMTRGKSKTANANQAA
ncbi:cytochrome c biogenesis protein ResB [Luteolibacter sp. GHJ8]|uniref:Cytochrome c biogenesis protein ResB n=1 Tax=Luteolibacter rhizosphaerae TaxID=2989719 RepID=A0ABT3G150_9BACT|nr:cytochrome c biogenesis protein ResB [Luteolibacter rhizosphaerae]MCW1913560.1 cytochrome c biogenesis protein ResB [Luteolibacter rhizosphaerae]